MVRKRPAEELYPAIECRERFRIARESLGLSEEEVAKILARTSGEIEHLERETLESTMTHIWLIGQLCKLYKVTPSELYTGYVRKSPLKVSDLQSLVRTKLEQTGSTLDELGEQVGWRLNYLMSGDIEKLCLGCGVDFCRGFGREFGVDWIDVLQAIINELPLSFNKSIAN